LLEIVLVTYIMTLSHSENLFILYSDNTCC